MPDLGAADGTTTSVYVGNLAFEATQDDLWRFLEARYGAVRSVRVMTDQDTGSSRGYAFATFAAHRAAAEVRPCRQLGGIRDVCAETGPAPPRVRAPPR